MTKTGTWLLWAMGAALVLFALLFARLGFFIIDEVIYLFAADTFLATGSLILQNGLHLGASGDLLWTDLLTLGPSGITSQYPAGSAVVWAPLVGLLDVRGVILFNALSMAAAFWATYALARQMFGDQQVAIVAAVMFLFATFALEYAFVIWPHAISVFTVTTAYLFFLKAMEDEERELRHALISGLILGAGLVFRIDNLLALPGLALLAVLFAAHPIKIFAGGAMGLAPAFAFLSVTNLIKFGSLNPLSYGGKEGLTNISAYVPLAIGLAIVLAALFLLRFKRPGHLRVWAAIAAIAVALAVLLHPALQPMALKFVKGSHRLLVDAREIWSAFNGVVDMEDGTKSFWGLAKKALGQSLPWLGCLILLLHPTFRKGQGRVIAMALIFAAAFAFPFVYRSWHGGMSSNMRYFLPFVPILAILGSRVICLLFEKTKDAKRPLAMAITLGFLASCAWTFLAPSGLAGAHQILSLYVLALVALICSLATIRFNDSSARLALLAAGIGIGVSVFNTSTDTLISQLRREGGSVLTDLSQGYEGNVLIYGRMMRSSYMNAYQIVASPQIGSDGPDIALVEAALAEGYRVLMPDNWAEDFTEHHPGFVFQDVPGPVDMAEVTRIP